MVAWVNDARRTTLRAVLYARKSNKQDRSEEQSDSVATQIRLGQRYADAHGMKVVGVFDKDDGRSGLLDRDKRPGLDAALKMLEAGDADAIVMRWKSRLSRDDLDRAVLVRHLEQLGVEWHAYDDGGLIDRSTYSGYVKDKADEMIDNGLSIRVRENWRRVHNDRLDKGLPKTGNARFGYKREQRYDATNDRWYPSGPFTVDPDTGPILRDLYLRYTAGSGFTPLVQWLRDEKVPTASGAEWTVRTVSRMLDSGFAAGRISKEAAHRDKIGSHERLLSEDEWTAYLRVRETKSKKSVGPRSKAPRWYLTGLVTCGLCGGSTFVNSYASPKSHVVCSRWRAEGKGGRCTGKMRMYRRDLEEMTSYWLGGHVDALAAQVPSRAEAQGRAQQACDDARAALTGVQEALGALAVKLARGLLDEDGYVVAQKLLLADLDAAKRALGAAQDEVTRLGPVDLDVYARLENAPAMSPGEFGGLIGKVLKRIEVRKATVTFVPVIGEPEVWDRKVYAPGNKSVA